MRRIADLEREDPLRRVIRLTTTGPADAVAEAYDALSPADLRLVEAFTGAIIGAYLATQRPAPTMSEA